MLREVLGGYTSNPHHLTLHDLAELIRRAGRTAGFEVQSEFRVSLGNGAAGEIDWVWLHHGHVVAAFEIEGQDAAPASLAADCEKFREVGDCLKFVALYSVASQLIAKGMPPGGLASKEWIARNWPEAGMPGIQVLLDTDLMAPGGIEAIQRQATGPGLHRAREIQARCAMPEFLIDRIVTLARYYAESVEEGVGANTRASDALLEPGLERPRSNWARVRSVILAARTTPVTAAATWMARDWFPDACAAANVSADDVARACAPFESELAAERVTDAKTLRARAAVRAVRYLDLRRRAGVGASSRAFEDFIPDEYVPVGKGANGTGRREHVVPLKLLRDRSNEMLAEGTSVAEVAAWLRDYLAIVEITKAEADALDHSHRWKTRMPPGWEFGTGCLYERLHRAGYAFSPHPAAPCRCAA
ncbi:MULTISPECIES: hypothetical protein [Ramlibacter]|uniref:Uncharacterized protein n=1 Tax=Ramlibacter pinisoli TaxID=2682844 RepID=A0A6N8IYI1_9BURK|nr:MULTISPECIES: hypothetical protein [Ramlibacter]MBA2962136.1 hypothetical protein [Ramlibacter sp. CGMCC 1.13660]MVQ32079.1 hypothetical protein [Ramlibacter pinisoli]